MLAARAVVLAETPSASETVNDVGYAVTNGFTFSGRFKEAFCYLVVYRDHVNLGFPQGAELPDANGRLKGTGKAHRHVRIASQADLNDPEVRRLIRVAANRAGETPATPRVKQPKSRP